MSKLPKHIITALRNGKTSLGDHPAFPPDEEEKFIIHLMSDVFDEVSENISGDVDGLKKQLSELIYTCKQLEKNSKQSLEKLCKKVIFSMFDVPENTVKIEIELVDTIDTKADRMFPERTKNFTFDSIEDMNTLTDEIYKRRMMNVLITGAAMFYTNKLTAYVSDIFEINPELPSLYKKILDINTYLLYADSVSFDNKKQGDGGKVSVNITSHDIQPTIKAEALMFPILINETIKGILELAIAHGLPKDVDRAKYILSKADFKFAEVWDMRLGYALWTLIDRILDELDIDIMDLGLNYLLMEFSKLNTQKFNSFLQNLFARTTKGKGFLEDICHDIQYKKESDDFDDFMKTKNDSTIQLNDDDCFTAEELLTDEYYTPEELLLSEDE